MGMTRPSQPEQMLLLCDREGRVRGQAGRSSCHAGDGLLHLAVLVIVHDQDERLLLQHRRASLWDGYWDLAGATHPLHTGASTESVEEAARRCLQQEWGIQARCAVRGAFTYFARDGDHAEHEHCVILCARHEGPVSPHPDHAYAARWADRLEVEAQMRAQPEHWTPWARLALQELRDLPLTPTAGRGST